MIALILYYLVLPFFLAWLVLKLIRKYGAPLVPEDVQRLYAEKPIEKKWFRVIRSDHKGKRWIADLEIQDEAVERAYAELQVARDAGEHVSFFVLNDKGEALRQIDS